MLVSINLLPLGTQHHQEEIISPPPLTRLWAEERRNRRGPALEKDEKYKKLSRSYLLSSLCQWWEGEPLLFQR